MAICEVCGFKLGFRPKDNKCINGYVCDSCYFKSKLRIPLDKVSIREVVKGIENQNKIDTSENTTLSPVTSYKPATVNQTSSVGKHIFLNETLKTFTIQGMSEPCSFDKLISFELVEDNDVVTKSKGNITRAVTGGILFGGVGAVIGATTAKQLSTTLIHKMYINVFVNDKNKNYKIILIRDTTKKDSFIYRINRELADNILAHLNSIISSNESQSSKSVENNTSVADEILKYKSLLEIGAITEDEYNQKKKQLLEL